MVSFHDIVGVLLEDVPGAKSEFVDDAWVDRSPVRRHLDRGGSERHLTGEGRARSLTVAAFGEQDVDDLAVLIDRAVEVGPPAGDLDVGLVDEPPIARGMT